MIIVAVLSLPFLFVLVRKPVLRRLALRNATRRPRETALVDPRLVARHRDHDRLVRRRRHVQLVDPPHRVHPTRPGRRDRVGQRARRRDRCCVARLGSLRDPNVDGTLALVATSASVASSPTAGAPVRAAPKAQLLETDFAAARDVRRRRARDRDLGPDAGRGRGRHRQRSRAHAATRASVTRSTRSPTAPRCPLRVVARAAEARRRGLLAGRRDRVEQRVRRARARSPGSTAGAARRPTGAPPQSIVLVSNRGGVEAGARLHRRREPACSRRGSRALAASVNDRKQAVLDRADRSGQSLSRLYTSLGSFAVLAGILLLVNIFFMLADERKSELGMLRAVGLEARFADRRVRDRGLVLRGALRDRRDVRRSRARARAHGRGREAVLPSRRRLEHHAALRVQVGERRSAGFVVGFVIAIVTVVLTSVWLSRFNIIQAIRDITEPPPAQTAPPFELRRSRGRGGRARC